MHLTPFVLAFDPFVHAFDRVAVASRVPPLTPSLLQYGEEMVPECARQCADDSVTLDSSDLEMPIDTQGCPGNNPDDPTPGD